MARIRVLVVDDSVLIRKIVSDILKEAPEIEVVGTASNGKIALSKIDQLSPDLVTLDIEMPVMNGLEALAEIRKTHPNLPVLMFSAVTEKGAQRTLDALSLGATSYVTKPSSKQKNVRSAIDSVREDLVPLVLALGRENQMPSPSPESGERSENNGTGVVSGKLPSNTSTNTNKALAQKRVDILAIGISTGGPNALAELMPTLPEDIPVPIVIVQHMPPVFTGYLAKRLDADCKYQVREGSEGEILEPGTCWIAPGGLHMTVEGQDDQLVIGLNESPRENHCRPAVDVLFRSVAATLGDRSLSVIMTGMGQDGLRGCEVLREHGGQVLAQDAASSVVWGMPGYVSRAGLAEKTLPLSQLGPEIMKRLAFGRTNPIGRS